MAHKGVTVAFFGCCCAWLLVSAIYYGYWVICQRRWVTVTPNEVYQSGWMRPGRLIRWTRTRNISTVIDFRGACDKGVKQEAAILAKAGVRYINIPCGRTPTHHAISAFVAIANSERAAGNRMLIHCKDGQGRAVFFAAVYRMEFVGWRPAEAYLGTRRLPKALRWICWLVPRAGLLSYDNPKTAMILNYQPTQSHSVPSQQSGVGSDRRTAALLAA